MAKILARSRRERESLQARKGSGTVHGSSFFRKNVHNLIRFNFAKKEETLRERANDSRGSTRSGKSAGMERNTNSPLYQYISDEGHYGQHTDKGHDERGTR